MGRSGYLNLSVSIKNVVSVIKVLIAQNADQSAIQTLANSFSSGVKKAPRQGMPQFGTFATLVTLELYHMLSFDNGTNG